MGRTTSTARRLSAAVAGLALLAAPLVATSAQAAPDDRVAVTDTARAAKAKKPTVKVMTRNLYLGANIMRPIAAMETVQPTEDCPKDWVCHSLAVLDAVAGATKDVYEIAEETDFGVRARMLAAELATERPDLVGLQEVAMYRTGPMDHSPANIGPVLVPNATNVRWDFLRMLLAEARAQGVVYKAVSVNTLSDVEAPAYDGTYTDQATRDAGQDVRLTMRDVILMRKGSGIRVQEERTRTFKDAMVIPKVAGKTFDFRRGYQWVDVRKKATKKTRAAKFRFINSHFEAFSSDIAFNQAREVVRVPGRYKGNTIFVCDCNSDPHLGTVKSQPPVNDTRRHWAPYLFLTSQKGLFHDTWLQIKEPHEGWTSGLSEGVRDADASGFDHRIDMVFARSEDGRRLKALSGTTTGNDLADRDEATGLWPSDHAGVVMRLRLR